MSATGQRVEWIILFYHVTHEWSIHVHVHVSVPTLSHHYAERINSRRKITELLRRTLSSASVCP